MRTLDDRLSASLASRKERSILRSLPPPNSSLVDFSSNDYLSFAKSTLLQSKFLQAIQSNTSPYGPASSRLLDGNTLLHLSLESQLSTFFKAESALLFNSGFDANVGLWTCLPDKNDIIIYDELIHASTHDGMRASRVSKVDRRSFKHNDVEDLERILIACSLESGVKEGLRSVWVTTETLFSMDGDLAPLVEIVECVERCLPRGNGHLVIDEAHSTGLYGLNGRGLVHALGLIDRITVRVHTFGKSMACTGAVVLVNPIIRSYLINYARPLIYSTVMPHMNVIAISSAFQMLSDGHGDAAAAQIHQLSSVFLTLVSTFVSETTPILSLAFPFVPSNSPSSIPSTTPIIPILTPSPRPLSIYLNSKGFLVRPISYPTVPRGKERIRICLHAGNTNVEVMNLVTSLKEWVQIESAGQSHSQALHLHKL